MELCDEDLRKTISVRLNTKQIFDIMLEITSCLRYMQALSNKLINEDVVHRDLKP
jgi:serine/threonine protein kinase